MNRKKIFTILFLLAGISFGAAFAQTSYPENASIQEKSMRGLWVTTVFGLDYPSSTTSDFRKEAVQIIEFAKNHGFNAIFLQVRPSGDAFYPSRIVKWSKFLTGKKGVAPADGFDPLGFWVEECHKRGMEIHAWLNPYRISTDPGDDVGEFPSERILEYEGRKYLNPGIPEVREHLYRIVEEILSNYKVDGIHFDDYFYPSKEVSDQEEFKKYGGGKKLRDWRIDNVDTLIRSIHDLCRSKNVSFGVSPFGIWANKSTNSLGSNTGGFESLTSQYADTRKWVKNGWVDYICPQIYWHKGFEVADYEVLADWWRNVVSGTDVRLYIGLATYKAMDADANSPWHGTDELLNQMNYNAVMPGIDGEIHFRYAYIRNSSEIAEAIKNFYSGFRRHLNQKLIVGRPYEDTVTESDSFFIGGASDPNQPLYINGEQITDRTASGLFGRYYALSPGVNRFELVCGNERFTRVVTKKYPETWATVPTNVVSKPFPSAWKAYRSGEKFSLRCVAPAGTEVYATLGGEIYALRQLDEVPYGHAAAFVREISLNPSGQPRVVWLGKAKYDCYRDGVIISTAEAEQPIEIIMDGAPIHAEVTVDYADTYLDNSREIGAFHMMPRGTKDYVTGEDGDLYRLGSGLWIKKSAVRFVWEGLKHNQLRDISIREGTARNGGSQNGGSMQNGDEGISGNESMERHLGNVAGGDVIVFRSAYTPILYAEHEGNVLAVNLHGVDFGGVDLSKIKGRLVKKATLDRGRLLLTLKDADALAGWYSESLADGRYQLVLREKKKSTSAEKPLENIVIMLDPGHGGYDSGGISLYGTSYTEKDIVLDLSFRLKKKLEEKGATVLMTRVGDLFVSLYDRLRYSRKELPDLFLSIHTDSLYESADLSRIRGASVYYKHSIAEGMAKVMAQTVYDRSELNSRGHHYYNFYVCRGTWAPSLLLENGFACSPFDLEFITDGKRSETLLNDYVSNIIDYFK